MTHTSPIWHLLDGGMLLDVLAAPVGQRYWAIVRSERTPVIVRVCGQAGGLNTLRFTDGATMLLTDDISYLMPIIPPEPPQ